MNLTGKKVLVVGSGISGIGAVQLLERYQACPILYDGNEQLSVTEIKTKLTPESKTQIILGTLSEDIINNLDLVILSPGVPTDLPMIQEIRKKGIKIWGEIEVAYQYSKGTVLAITGTNGKTSTTTLLGQIMNHVRDEVFVVGNIGNPYTEIVSMTTDKSTIVAEISSFQLETIETFRPKVSAILNVTPDHLNRHHTFEEYVRVKALIASNQTSNDTCILNYEDELLKKMGENLHTNVLFFSSLRTLERGIYLAEGIIWYNDGTGPVKVCQTNELKLIGLHNYENIMAAVAMALSIGTPLNLVREVILSFTGVEHRIEYVTEKNGVVYYNDSKGTNPDAAIKGIQAMNRNTLLIAGGYDKESEYEEWIKAFEGKVKYLVLIGATREKIAQAAQSCGFMNTILADTLEEAVSICEQKADVGDAVLLSPACASWGMFKNYEERGEMFKQYVNNL